MKIGPQEDGVEGKRFQTVVQFNSRASFTGDDELTVVPGMRLESGSYNPSESYGQGPEAKVAVAKLPRGLYYHSAVCDGNDSVYIFGG
jgi:hypothetical protein